LESGLIDRYSDTWIEVNKMLEDDRRILQQKIASHLTDFSMTQFYRGQLSQLEKISNIGKDKDAAHVKRVASIY
jgi:hypothetical protein